MNLLRYVVLPLALCFGIMHPNRIAKCQPHPDSVMVARVIPQWTIGSLHVQLGAAHLGLAELNETLTANARPAFATNVATVGLSAAVRYGRLIVGGTGESALPQRVSSPGWRNTVAFGSATLDAGLVLAEGTQFAVYSYGAIGVRKTSLRIQQTQPFAYEDGVRDPARGMALSSTNAVTGVGIAAEFRFATRTTGAFAIGLRAGIAQPLGGAATSTGESTVTHTPRESTGRSLRISIGKPIGKRRDVMGALSTTMLPIITR